MYKMTFGILYPVQGIFRQILRYLFTKINFYTKKNALYIDFIGFSKLKKDSFSSLIRIRIYTEKTLTFHPSKRLEMPIQLKVVGVYSLKNSN